MLILVLEEGLNLSLSRVLLSAISTCSKSTKLINNVGTTILPLGDLIHTLKSWNQVVQYNKQYLRKALYDSFHLNSYTLGCHPQNQKLEPGSKNKWYRRDRIRNARMIGWFDK